MSSKGIYYQFNIDFNGSYIRGYMTTTFPQDCFFRITEPTYSNSTFSANIKPINNEINLSKSVVVCYFAISEN